MPAEYFRILINLWTLAKDTRKDGELPPLDDIAFELRMEIHEAKSMLDILCGKEYSELSESKGVYRVNDWKKFQYTDDSKERVRAFRERKKAAMQSVTPPVTVKPGNDSTVYSTVTEQNRTDSPLPPSQGAETAPLVESLKSKTNRDQSILAEQQEDWFTEWYAKYPRKAAPKVAKKAFFKAVKTAEEFQTITIGLEKLLPDYLSREPQHIPQPATWLNQERWNDDPLPPRRAPGEPPPGHAPFGRNGEPQSTLFVPKAEPEDTGSDEPVDVSWLNGAK